MKILVHITLAIQLFIQWLETGIVGEIICRIVDDIKPESIYFAHQDGHHGVLMVVDVPKASGIPYIAEPWYLNFEAICEFRIAMTPDD